MMKRYLLFGFMTYYPGGGMQDLQFDFDTRQEFESSFDPRFDHYHIFDRETARTTNEEMSADAIRRWVQEHVR